MLTGYASSPMGKELCRNLMPSSDISEILQGQMETSDALTRVMKKGSLSFSGIRDIRGSLLRLKVGSTVGMAELLNIAATLDVALRAKSYGRREADDEDQDSLEGLFAQIEPLSNLNHEIRRCIIDEETMADDASPTLKSIRRQIKLTNERIHSQLHLWFLPRISVPNCKTTWSPCETAATACLSRLNTVHRCRV